MPRRARHLPSEVFLSHSSKDGVFATRIAELVRRHGIPVWYSTTNIVGAQQWHDEIGKALARCDWFLLVLSPNSVKSRWVRRELVYALDDPRYDQHIVPLVYRPCDYRRLSWALHETQRIDFTGSYEQGCRDLLRVWGIGYAGKAKGRRRE